MCQSLAVFDGVTTYVSGEKYGTRSMLVPCIMLIKKHVSDFFY